MFALTTAAALFATGFVAGRISSQAKQPTLVNDFQRLDLCDDGMISITYDGEEVANVWIDHRNRVEVEFPRSNVEVHEAFDPSNNQLERVKVSTLTIRNDYWERMLMHDEFVPLDGFHDDPIYDDWTPEEVADLMELINGDTV